MLDIIPKELWFQIANYIDNETDWIHFKSSCNTLFLLFKNIEVLKIVMYYTNWCKFSKKSLPEFDLFIQNHCGLILNNKKLIITKFNCEDDKVPRKMNKTAKDEDINGYPTFRYYFRNKKYDFENMDRTCENFLKMCNEF